jgi:DeoR-like helix-turn-helix domain
MADTDQSIDPNSLAARYLSASLLGEFIGLIDFCVNTLKIDGTDLQILACIAYMSSWEPLNQAIDEGRITAENFDIENLKHKPINAKSIYLTLGMSRETVRRRLVYLESLGLFHKVEGGYIFPVQHGSADVTYNVRKYFMAMAQRSMKQFKKYLPD